MNSKKMPKHDEIGKWFKKNIGSCLSWAITFAWLIFIYFKIHNGILPTNLNEFGDFIAGAFAPLAFFWLVRGFYQQGKGLEQNSEALNMQAIELKKTTEALELQVQEMKASVEQQSRLARVYEEELQQKHFQVQPYFEYSFQLTDNFLHDEPICDDDGNVIDHYKDRVIKFTLNIKNIGGTSRNLFIKHRKDQPYLQQTQYKLEHAEIMTILFDVDGQMAQELNDGIEDLTRTFRIRYQDIYGKQYENYIACDVITYIDDETGQVYLQPNLKILSQSQALNHTV